MDCQQFVRGRDCNVAYCYFCSNGGVCAIQGTISLSYHCFLFHPWRPVNSGEATIIPLYQVAKDLHLLNSYSGLIIPALASPVAVIVLKSFFDGVPNDLLESVQIDGGDFWRIFTSIMLPLTRPAMASMAILTFIGSWNNFLWPFLSITDDNLFTLPMGIPTLMGQYSEDYVKPMVINAVASVPIIILFIIFEKQIVKGISMSGIKG